MMVDRFSWLIENELAGMARPPENAAAFAELRAAGVGAVVTLTEAALPAHMLQEAGLVWLHLPVPNFHPPEPDQIEAFVEFATRSIAEGRPVAVHCLAGCGRTGTMLACYLVNKGMKPAAAVRAVRQARPCSIETGEQEAVVYDYADLLAHRRDSR